MNQSSSGAAAGLSVMHELMVRAGVPEERPVPVPATLRYDSTDPYAVCLSLGVPSTGTVDWVFARSLLLEGLRRPRGLGDVLVRPLHRGQRGSVRIVLRSPAGVALLEIAVSAVTAFLEATHLVVAPGTEELHIDLDRLVAELMDGSE
ncbi:SsgA family sporulation/cell division regulator [Streptomyces sp. NPDC006703]|uniref:SsgA family sporulation/cell division regulator n=1 Tax=Streptomyces sp. NPDC006703 TaxID=3364759 RepID=UPI0036BFABA5